MKKYFFSMGVLGALFFTANPQRAGADVDVPKIDKTKKALATPPLTDRQILTHLYLENLWEAGVDEAAQERSLSPEIKEMAADFMKNHTFLAKEMRAQGGRLGIALSPVPAPHSSEERKILRQDAKFKQLKRLSGEAFDQGYKSLMAKCHKDTIRFIKRQRTLLPKDSPIFSLLAVELPKIQAHYDVLASTTTVQP